METKEMTAEDRQKSYFYEVQHMIYYDLPVLVSKIFCAAFANCECGFLVVAEEDIKFIEGFVDALDDTFKVAVDGQVKLIKKMLKTHAERSRK